MRWSEIISNFSSVKKAAIVEDMSSFTLPEDDDPIFEMANLAKPQTGVDGIIYISTQQGSHGPRVKYFFGRPSEKRSFSVSISDRPVVLAKDKSVSDKECNGMSPVVISWVRINYVALLDFWNNGTDWTDPEVDRFKKSLQKYSY